MFISRNQFLIVDRKSIGQKLQEISRHLTIVHKTCYRSNLTLLNFLFQFLHHIFRRNIIYKYIRITRNFTAIAAIYIVADKNFSKISLYDILQKHQIIIITLFGKFHETRYLAVWHLDNEILHPFCFMATHPYRQILAFITKKHPDLLFFNLYRLQVRKYFLHEKAMYKITVKIFHFPFRLIKDYMILTESGQYLLLVNPDSVFQLCIDYLRNFTNQLMCLVYSHVFAFSTGSNNFMFGNTDLIELLQIG